MESKILVRKEVSKNYEEEPVIEPLQLWDPSRLTDYEVTDYLTVARKYFSSNLRFSQDVMLTWLVFHEYRVKDAIMAL